MIERPVAIQMFGWLFGGKNRRSGDGTIFNGGNPFGTGKTQTQERGLWKGLLPGFFG